MLTRNNSVFGNFSCSVNIVSILALPSVGVLFKELCLYSFNGNKNEGKLRFLDLIKFMSNMGVVNVKSKYIF